MSQDNISIVIAEDDPRIIEIQKLYIEKIPGFETVGIATTVAEAKELVDAFTPDLVILDVFFKEGSGFDLLSYIRQKQRQIDVILVTAAKEPESLKKALRGGTIDYILKPFMFDRFKFSLEKYKNQRQQIEKLNKISQANADAFWQVASKDADKKLPSHIGETTLKQVLDFLEAIAKEVTATELATQTKLSRTTVRRYLEYLISINKVSKQSIHIERGRPKVVYKLI